MENLDVINTKTCKTCNETKDLLKFPKQGFKCSVCKNHQQRIDYFLKKKITVLPKKRIFIFLKEEKKIGKKNVIKKKQKIIQKERQYKRQKEIQKERLSKCIKNLSNEYIVLIIKSTAKYNNLVPDLSEENILKVKTRIEEKRLSKITKIKKCKICKETFIKKASLKASNLCNKCRYPYYKNKYGENYKSKLYFFHKENLTNTYIKNTIISNIHYHKLKIKHSEISDVYVELKRKELILKRKIKNENKQRSS